MERISALFQKIIDGRKAIEKLNSAGYKNARLDIADASLEEYSNEINITSFKTPSSLSTLVSKSETPILSINKSPLVASSPMVSGLSSSEEAHNISTRLVVDVDDEEKGDEIKKLIRSLGGIIKQSL